MPYQTIYIDDVEITIDNLDVRLVRDVLLVDISKGKYIAIYDPNTADCSIYHGEVEEIDQERRLKRPTYTLA